jgi:hypothetical protein
VGKRRKREREKEREKERERFREMLGSFENAGGHYP